MRRHILLFCATVSLSSIPTGAHAVAKQPAKSAPRKVCKPKPYTTSVSSARPLFVGVVLDQSGSNRHPIAGTDEPMSKGTALAHAVNNNFEMMVAAANDGQTDGTDTEPAQMRFKPYFHVVGAAYSTGTRPLIGDQIRPLSVGELYKAAKWLDANHQPVNGNTKPEDWVHIQWLDPKKPVTEGNTMMGEGLAEMLPHLQTFTAEHPDAPAPVIMHFTDGKPEGGTLQHMQVAAAIKSTGTKDGKTLLFNVHVGQQGEPIMFPNQERIDAIADREVRENAQRVFDMSSPMPPGMLAKARGEFSDFRIPDGARTMVYNAGGAVLTKLLQLGTVQNMGNK